MLRRPASLLFASFCMMAVISAVACDGSVVDPIDAETAGGTPAPDGSRGYCCPARTGGCALMGGYREEGECPKTFDICDNMCEQKIVKDEHGCDTLTYKTPPVQTTFAGTGSCSDPVFNGAPRGVDAGDSGADADPDSGHEGG